MFIQHILHLFDGSCVVTKKTPATRYIKEIPQRFLWVLFKLHSLSTKEVLKEGKVCNLLVRTAPLTLVLSNKVIIEFLVL
jgi:hypothetical protein